MNYFFSRNSTYKHNTLQHSSELGSFVLSRGMSLKANACNFYSIVHAVLSITHSANIYIVELVLVQIESERDSNGLE